ncbi:anti-sigma factor domain-containing protein [Rhodococcus sp. KRD162]|uniref:anti-sigma factor n=1 Tax=unclassified Rhodococcus (in: high G+C Gram-positive bacteria) TaxID=192944 RepID=UPI0019CFBDFF|nr:anti-sigma factor [Rhodococcus sp. KRD162]
MNESSRQRLFDDAEVYALHAITDSERRDIETERQRVDDTARAQFDVLVSEIHETLALVAAIDATPAPDRLRRVVLDRVAASGQDPTVREPTVRETPSNVTPLHRHRRERSKTWRYSMMSAAAAVIVAVGGVVVVTQTMGNDAQPSQVEQIVAAPDARQATADFPGGGTATVSYSLSRDAVVVTLDGVPQPPPGRAYQMWFVDGTPRSAGVMTDEEITSKSGTVVDGLGAATNFAFSLEPAGGSPQPTQVLTMLTLNA